MFKFAKYQHVYYHKILMICLALLFLPVNQIFHCPILMFCFFLIFQGISPKLEFMTVTNIKESISPELDALDEALRDARVRCFSFFISTDKMFF